jgi:LCT (Lysosomal Cystine Transporter) family transporter
MVESIVPLISDIAGWSYFIIWSISFYPQIYTNWRRKSVVGLSFDYLALNVLGYLCYSVFNVVMYFSPVVQQQYIDQHKVEGKEVSLPATIPDIVFALHGIAMTTIMTIQCLIYERGGQRVSRLAWLIIGLLLLGIGVVGAICFFDILQIIWLIQACGYAKMIISLLKYAPQAYLNWHRKSTAGWSIAGVLMDMSGGFLSFFQMFLMSFYTSDWSQFEGGNVPKFGLSVISVLYNFVFIFQHYVLYRKRTPEKINETDKEAKQLDKIPFGEDSPLLVDRKV